MSNHTMSALDAVETVLAEAKVPMSCSQLTTQVLDRELWATTARSPEQSIHAYLAVDMKTKGAKSRFQRTAPGTFALRAWGLPEVAARTKTKVVPQAEPEEPVDKLSFTDAAELVLSQHGNGAPMHYRTLTEKALELGLVRTQGQTPAATLHAAIINEVARDQKRGEAPRFVRYGKGMIGLVQAAKTAGKVNAPSDDGLAAQIQSHNDELKRQLHEKVSKLTAAGFEDLVGRLLIAMGFEDVEVTNVSRDGGIDVRGVLVVGGVIRTKMAVQVKKWKDNVQAPVVQQVRGSLGAHEQGLIITTGGFSSGARQEALRSDATPVALMDGPQLINLLVEHDILTEKVSHHLLLFRGAEDELVVG